FCLLCSSHAPSTTEFYTLSLHDALPIYALVPAQKALAAVQRLGERFGRTRVVDHLIGKSKDNAAWETSLSTFGIGKDLSILGWRDRKSTRLNSSHVKISYAVFCLKKKTH